MRTPLDDIHRKQATPDLTVDQTINFTGGPTPVVADESSKSWNDIVFENRNRDYGAYVLRQGYSNAVVIGLAISVVLMLGVFFFPAIAELIEGKKIEEPIVRKKLVYTELSAPPPIDKPKPPPPQIVLPKLQKVIKFVPPKVVKEEVRDVAPTIEEIKQNETASVAVDGATEVSFEEPVEEVIVEDPNEIFTVVEQNPEFPGGYDQLMTFIKQNLKYPTTARKMDLQGTVYVSFVVHKDGTIGDVRVLRGFFKDCDNEAVRVVGLMPPWTPGKQNGRVVNVRYTMPIRFRIS